MRKNLAGGSAPSCHSLGAALAHSDAVPPTPAGQKGPFAAQICYLADCAFELAPGRVDCQPKVLSPQQVAFAVRASELDHCQA